MKLPAFVLIGGLLLTQASFAFSDDVLTYVGRVTATEPNVIRMITGTAEVEIPRQYATKHYLVGDNAEIEVPEAVAANLKLHPLAKRK